MQSLMNNPQRSIVKRIYKAASPRTETKVAASTSETSQLQSFKFLAAEADGGLHHVNESTDGRSKPTRRFVEVRLTKETEDAGVGGIRASVPRYVVRDSLTGRVLFRTESVSGHSGWFDLFEEPVADDWDNDDEHDDGNTTRKSHRGQPLLRVRRSSKHSLHEWDIYSCGMPAYAGQRIDLRATSQRDNSISSGGTSSPKSGGRRGKKFYMSSHNKKPFYRRVRVKYGIMLNHATISRVVGRSRRKMLTPSRSLPITKVSEAPVAMPERTASSVSLLSTGSQEEKPELKRMTSSSTWALTSCETLPTIKEVSDSGGTVVEHKGDMLKPILTLQDLGVFRGAYRINRCNNEEQEESTRPLTKWIRRRAAEALFSGAFTTSLVSQCDWSTDDEEDGMTLRLARGSDLPLQVALVILGDYVHNTRFH